MDVFLVGNGYDLHHKFPTGYINFLNVIRFLIKKYNDSFDSVGKVFGDKELQDNDAFIKECYELHKDIYEATPLPKEKVESILSRIKDNMWFRYFCNSAAKNIKWIDFEKEIIRVLDAFSNFFDGKDFLDLTGKHLTFYLSEFPENPEDRYILTQFAFFFEKSKDTRAELYKIMHVLPKYAIEKISGSNTYHVLKDEIASDLYSSLRVFADVLRDYLVLFVDAPSQEYAKKGTLPVFAGMPKPNYVYSFNYTNTFEILYSNNVVQHIHGKTDTNIVLGINPNKNDVTENMDTTFLQFKKYFQRVFFKTDVGFLSQMKSFVRTSNSNDIKLFVVGHSLDSTDEDVIKQIFELSKSIIVLYHNETSAKNLIKNLVEMYGKAGLDKLREKHDLKFLPQGEIVWETRN